MLSAAQMKQAKVRVIEITNAVYKKININSNYGISNQHTGAVVFYLTPQHTNRAAHENVQAMVKANAPRKPAQEIANGLTDLVLIGDNSRLNLMQVMYTPKVIKATATKVMREENAKAAYINAQIQMLEAAYKQMLDKIYFIDGINLPNALYAYETQINSMFVRKTEPVKVNKPKPKPVVVAKKTLNPIDNH